MPGIPVAEAWVEACKGSLAAAHAETHPFHGTILSRHAECGGDQKMPLGWRARWFQMPSRLPR
jgi:hypothetical protein